MATIDITGTITDAGGTGVEGVPVRLSPLPQALDSPVLLEAVGVILDPIEELTASDGTFTITAVQGYSYLLEIPAIGLKEAFVAPELADIEFHLLGLVPTLESAKDFTDADGVDKVTVNITVPRVKVVLQRFDTLVVQSAPDAAAGPWTDVEEILLLSNTDSYSATDDDPDAYYRAFYKNSVNLDEGMASDPILGGGDQAALSIREFKDVYLFGVDLTDGDGNPYPTAMFQWYIDAAVKYVESQLDIKITAENIVGELHDHYAGDYGRWGYFQLKNYPVSRIDSVVFQYPSMTEGVTIDNDWVVLEDEGVHGVIQIVPGQGNIADVLLIPGSLMPMWSGAFGRVPGVWQISYRTGFEPDAVPADIKHLIGMIASLGIMNVAGDLVGGSGLQGWSVSVPGLSQNITTTNSSTNAGFGARLLMYKKDIKEMLPVLKAFYGKTTKMVVA